MLPPSSGWSGRCAELSYFATNSQSVSQSVRVSSPSVTLDQILAEVSYGVDVMGRLPWREDGSAFFIWLSTGVIIWPCGIFFAWPSTEIFFIDPLESSSLDSLLESSLPDPLLESSSLSQSGSESLATESVSQSVGQTVRLGLEPLLVCVCVPAVSVSRRCPVLSVCLVLSCPVDGIWENGIYIRL
jgi:hypothetical protein